MFKRPFKTTLSALALAALSACSLVKYQPVATVNQIDTSRGYRFETSQIMREEDDTLIILMFSGGGTRAAALGYGVLEQLQQQKVNIGGKSKSLMSNVDLVVGVSGGSVLAAYFALKGEETIPLFYKRFLHQNFQRQVVKQVFSMSNLPRLASPEYGRGDLLQEQFENYLFGKTTFRDLELHRKGPFAVISATDMGAGERLNFTQEYFDSMCIDLGGLRVARAVAASSAVPMVFAPITLNNNGGNCNYTLPPQLRLAGAEMQKQPNATYQELKERFTKYSDSKNRPYIHLIDGGLTDNLGMRSLLDMTEVYPEKVLEQQIRGRNLSHIAVISVNAQNRISSNLDKTPAIPGFRDVASSIINIPIDQHTQESLRRFRAFVDKQNENKRDSGISFSFVSLNLKDLPDSELRNKVLNIPTSFYLPPEDVDNLRTAAAELMKQSEDYQNLLNRLSAHPNPESIFAEPPPPEPENGKTRKKNSQNKDQAIKPAVAQTIGSTPG